MRTKQRSERFQVPTVHGVNGAECTLTMWCQCSAMPRHAGKIITANCFMNVDIVAHRYTGDEY